MNNSCSTVTLLPPVSGAERFAAPLFQASHVSPRSAFMQGENSSHGRRRLGDGSVTLKRSAAAILLREVGRTFTSGDCRR